MFFFEGPKVLFKVALAVLNLSFGSSKAQKQIPGFFELTRALRNLSIDITHEDVLVPEVCGHNTAGCKNCTSLCIDHSVSDLLSYLSTHMLFPPPHPVV